jgi:hypothetical protein
MNVKASRDVKRKQNVRGDLCVDIWLSTKRRRRAKAPGGKLVAARLQIGASNGIDIRVGRDLNRERSRSWKLARVATMLVECQSSCWRNRRSHACGT